MAYPARSSAVGGRTRVGPGRAVGVVLEHDDGRAQRGQAGVGEQRPLAAFHVELEQSVPARWSKRSAAGTRSVAARGAAGPGDAPGARRSVLEQANCPAAKRSSPASAATAAPTTSHGPFAVAVRRRSMRLQRSDSEGGAVGGAQVDAGERAEEADVPAGVEHARGRGQL